MSNKQTFWTIRKPTGWGVKRQGNPQAASLHEEQTEAWREARRLTGGNKDDVSKPEKGMSILTRILKMRVRPARLR